MVNRSNPRWGTMYPALFGDAVFKHIGSMEVLSYTETDRSSLKSTVMETFTHQAPPGLTPMGWIFLFHKLHTD